MRQSGVGGGADSGSVEFGTQMPGVTYGAGITRPAEVAYGIPARIWHDLSAPDRRFFARFSTALRAFVATEVACYALTGVDGPDCGPITGSVSCSDGDTGRSVLTSCAICAGTPERSRVVDGVAVAEDGWCRCRLYKTSNPFGDAGDACMRVGGPNRQLADTAPYFPRLRAAICRTRSTGVFSNLPCFETSGCHRP